MSFQQGLSGLDVSSQALNATSNNVANSSTVGFKSSTTRFADVYAASLNGSSANQVGIGSTLASVFQQFTQGDITTTSNSLDIAINGKGFYRMSNNGTISYTRDGEFQLDKDGYIVNSSGLELTGYAADATTGAIIPGNIVPLQVTNGNIAPSATTESQVGVNLNSSSTTPSAMTSGTATFANSLATSSSIVLDSTNNTLNLSVDGTAVSVTVPTGTYSASTLATAVQSAVNEALPTGTAVTVSLDSSSHLVITSNSKGTVGSTGSGSTVNTISGTLETALLGTATSVAGADNFYASSTTSQGTLTGTVLGATTTITASSNDTLDLTVDGTAYTVTVAAGSYTPAQLATAVQTALHTAGATNTTVTANTYNELVITSGTQGSTSSVVATGGDGEASMLGTSPVSVAGGTNINSVNSSGFTSSTAQTVYDTLGIAHNLTMYFVKTSEANVWQMYTSLDGETTQAGSTPTLIQFDSSGKLKTSMPLTENYVVTTGATANFSFTLDLSGTTQYGTSFSVNSLTQDGYTSGQLSGISVSSDGTIEGSYSNGKTKNMGQLVLSNFNNPNGLQSLGGNQWAETASSGQPITGTPGTGVLGVVQAGAVESSNVDLTKELVNMITEQRAYQANAQSIKTEDSILQTLVNLS